ncbi:hypothetical protein [Myxococcus sp. AM010]|uniref:Vgb family protein n=1 Tax=Myxococcus sp. AM010 TaxID=2745138 RepID=UPI001595B6B3|nr:hypothetical protein [Myxococcus sp. AM010]
MRNGTVIFALAVVISVGCGDAADPDPGGCPETGTGTLELSIEGLPASASPHVLLRRGSESREVRAGGRLAGLAAGMWTLSPEPVAVSGGRVRAAYDAPARQLCVLDGEVANAALQYALIPSSQRLWLSTSNGAAEVEAFAAVDLETTGAPSAAVQLGSSPGIPRASGLAFDRRGNLWVALGSGELRRYPAGDLGASGVKSPDVIMRGGVLSAGSPGPIAIAFDAAGDLWTSIGFSDTVIRFGAAQLVSGTAPAPQVVLSGLGAPSTLAFDATGNLWVGDVTAGASRVHKVAASSLQASGAVTPVVSIDVMEAAPGRSFAGPAGLAFDGERNLWVSYGASGVVVRLTPADQEGSGAVSVVPSIQIDAGGPKEVAFDEGGGLWMAYDSGRISRLSPSQLSVSGAPTPDVVISSPDLGATHGVAVYPAPANLPLFHRLP